MRKAESKIVCKIVEFGYNKSAPKMPAVHGEQKKDSTHQWVLHLADVDTSKVDVCGFGSL